MPSQPIEMSVVSKTTFPHLSKIKNEKKVVPPPITFSWSFSPSLLGEKPVGTNRGLITISIKTVSDI